MLWESCWFNPLEDNDSGRGLRIIQQDEQNHFKAMLKKNSINENSDMGRNVTEIGE